MPQSTRCRDKGFDVLHSHITGVQMNVISAVRDPYISSVSWVHV